MVREEHIKIVTKFYHCFQNKDCEGMASCYSKDVQFHDPVFQTLKDYEVNAMWRMLIERSTSLEISFSPPEENKDIVQVNWEAKYPFGKTSRLIHNKILATFQFKDGLIIKHTDEFSLSSWFSMTFGIVGLLFGWSPFLRNRVRKEAQAGLKLFIKRKKLCPTKD